MIPTQRGEIALPFDTHKDLPLGDVPADYLLWILRKCKLSSGLRAAVASELQRRGFTPPPAPAPTIPTCSRCGNTLYDCRWQQDSAGRRRIRAERRWCHKFLVFAPMIPPFTDEADKNASPAPVLDALTKLETLGIEVQSDGRRAWVAWPDSKRVPNDLLATIRQCSHLLARMIGDNRPQTHEPRPPATGDPRP